MWHMQQQQTFNVIITVVIVMANLQRSLGESRIYTGGYGFGAPINVGGESAYGLANAFGSSGSNTGLGLSSGLSGLHNGIGFGSASGGLGYGLSAGNYPNSYSGLNNFNSFQHNPFAQNVGGLYPNSNFGNSFFPGSGAYFGQNFGGYGNQRPFHFGNGFGNFGLPVSNGLGNSLNSGYPLSTGFAGLGNSGSGGFSGYGGGGLFGSGFGIGNQHHFK